jgi:hypothetical protein
LNPGHAAHTSIVVAVALTGACAFAAAGAFAQASAPRAPGPDDRIPGTRVREAELPLRFALPGPPPQVRYQRAPAPLDPAHLARLRRAADMREGGLPERARDSLLALDRELPHHPYVVAELALAEIATGDERTAAARLLRERAACRDSLLGSHDLAGALEHLARPREAVQVAIESWIAAPAEGPWASGVLLRLAPLEPRVTTEAMRAACARLPQRGDLRRGLAFLLARQGQPAAAERALAAAERPGAPAGLRRLFADEALLTGVGTDSTAAGEALAGVAADTTCDLPNRLDAARRTLDLAAARGRGVEAAARIAAALDDLPPARWGPDLQLAVARGLREGGRGAQAAALIAGGAPGRSPELALERAYDLAREGPPERALPALDSLALAWPPGRFPLAEAQFWAGHTDSALANYRRASEDTDSPDAMAALDRVYLIEERPGADELRALGAIAWERWRGDAVRARTLADSLWGALPNTSHFYAAAAMEAYAARAAAGDWRATLVPLAAIADSLPGDRLAPLARQRAGESWLRLGDDRNALAQFEECLARYPKAWNSPEVRRQVERLRKEGHL